MFLHTIALSYFGYNTEQGLLLGISFNEVSENLPEIYWKLLGISFTLFSENLPWNLQQIYSEIYSKFTADLKKN